MTPTRQGSFRLFRIAGIDVFVHWSWFLAAMILINQPLGNYASPVWKILEYLTLFAIVLLHEMGHAFACRQVGGQANQIVLWPLGGVAYVRPPPRPGPTLWSIAAGPLVNVALTPIILGALYAAGSAGLKTSAPDQYNFIEAVLKINSGLLIFNLLPIYPLDGGQILQSLLWFIFGRARSLMIATILGLLGIGGFLALAFLAYVSNPSFRGNFIWLCFMGVFIALNCWRGWLTSRVLLRLEKAPRRSEYHCPLCQTSPPVGIFWGCGKCGKPFDIFESHGTCPNCGENFGVTACVSCGRSSPIDQWIVAPPLPTSSAPPPPPIPPATV